jgi:hypothetical protein
MSSPPETVAEIVYVPAPPRPVNRWRRIGCIILLIPWFLVLLTPCALILLATQGEITVRYGSIPGQEVRVYLQMEALERGLVVSTGSTSTGPDGTQCVQTDTRYLLWQGQSEPSVYCECFRQTDGEWQPLSLEMNVCTTR